MRAISLHEPWASLVARGLKRVETRSWPFPPKFRSHIVAIHATKNREAIVDGTAARLFSLAKAEPPAEWPCGRIIAVVRLWDAKLTHEIIGSISSIEEAFGNYAPGRWAWQLTEATLLRDPFEVRGYQGFWPLTDEQQDMVLARTS